MDKQISLNLLKEIINFHKTPVYIVSKRIIQENCRNFSVSFRRYYPNASFFYSYKTNSIPAILKIIHEEGFGAEVVSPFELDLALRLLKDPDRIIFNGPDKGAEGIRKAIDLGIRLINIDSLDELITVSKIAEEKKRRVRIGLRIRPLHNKGAHFGFSFNFRELLFLLNKISDCSWLELDALHCHLGSNIKKPLFYLEAIRKNARLLKIVKKETGIEIESLDLGGGFGIDAVKNTNFCERILNKYCNYQIKVKENVKIEHFASGISSCLKNEFGKYKLKLPALLLEPGRAIIGNAQDLFLSVISIKGNRIVVDGGLFNMALPLLAEQHSAKILGKEDSKATKRYRIEGNLCAPEDILYNNVILPQPETGDVLIVKDTGAYFNSFASNFSFPRPPNVMINEDNSFELIRRRESFEDMVGRDKI